MPHYRLESLESRWLLSWGTVDDYQYLAGYEAAANGLAVDSAGQIYAAGSGDDLTAEHAVVKRSSDGGATWSAPLDDYVVPGTSYLEVSDIAVDSTGNRLFNVGTLYFYDAGSGYTSYGFVRRSEDAGLTWSTVDQFTGAGSNAKARAVTTDATGNVYVVGQTGTSFNTTWIVRRSQDGGSTWSTVDSFSTRAQANAVFVHPTAGIFVAGSTAGGYRDQYTKWVVRRSQNGGNSWTSVDNFQLDAKKFAYAQGLGSDVAGNLYAVGFATFKDQGGPLDYNHWIVRKSTNAGVTWTTVDNFQLQPRTTARAFGFGKDSAGNLFVVGMGQRSGSNSDRWVVRSNPGGTGAWSTIDEFQLATGKSASAAAIDADASGNVFVAGRGADAGSKDHWIVRSVTPAAAAAAGTQTASAPAVFADFQIFAADDDALEQLV